MVETVSVDEIKRSIENDRSAVVNVPSEDQFEAEHIPYEEVSGISQD